MQVKFIALLTSILTCAGLLHAETNFPPASAEEQLWNWHLQNTAIVQGDPGFPAKYSGPNSLLSGGEIRETISLDLIAAVRLWRRGGSPRRRPRLARLRSSKPSASKVFQRRSVPCRHQNSQFHFFAASSSVKPSVLAANRNKSSNT